MGKKGILVYDRVDAKYNKWFIDYIIETGKEVGLSISLLHTEDFVLEEACQCDFAIMRNRNEKMNAELEKKGIRCFNSSYVCKIGNDKWQMYKDFMAAGIPVMYTQEKKLPYPFVMKPRDGHGGENVYLVRNECEYKEILEELGSKNLKGRSEKDFIYQMVASEKGRDIRVYVVGDMILTAMERKSASYGDKESSDNHTEQDGQRETLNKCTEFRANYSLGGSAVEYALTEEELRLAAKVQKHIGADFVGIDIIYNNGKPVVNEIEDAVGSRMLYEATDLDPVREYISWIVGQIG